MDGALVFLSASSVRATDVAPSEAASLDVMTIVGLTPRTVRMPSARLAAPPTIAAVDVLARDALPGATDLAGAGADAIGSAGAELAKACDVAGAVAAGPLAGAAAAASAISRPAWALGIMLAPRMARRIK